jgi:hypothetical protein
MKTAVQQVFSELEELHPQLFNVYTTEGKEFINHFHKYLAIEKEQMALCYKVGVIDGNNGVMFNFDKYYNETYKPESNETL